MNGLTANYKVVRLTNGKWRVYKGSKLLGTFGTEAKAKAFAKRIPKVLRTISKLSTAAKLGVAEGVAAGGSDAGLAALYGVGGAVRRVARTLLKLNTVTANIAGDPRYEILNERRHLVVPVTMIVTGVLNGSKGPLFYPTSEISKDPEAWNNTPLVVFHPEEGGEPVSARRPSVLNRQGVGYVFNARVSKGNLVAEAWFDVDKTRRINSQILRMISNGEPIELSTGLFTDNEPRNGVYNGKDYNFIARNYKPDHLAILPGTSGACSIEDGCGVLIRNKDKRPLGSLKTNKLFGTPNAKETIVDFTKLLVRTAKGAYKAGSKEDSVLGGFTAGVAGGYRSAVKDPEKKDVPQTNFKISPRGLRSAVKMGSKALGSSREKFKQLSKVKSIKAQGFAGGVKTELLRLKKELESLIGQHAAADKASINLRALLKKAEPGTKSHTEGSNMLAKWYEKESEYFKRMDHLSGQIRALGSKYRNKYTSNISVPPGVMRGLKGLIAPQAVRSSITKPLLKLAPVSLRQKLRKELSLLHEIYKSIKDTAHPQELAQLKREISALSNKLKKAGG